MTVVVDTSILVDHLRGHAEARRILREARRSGERLAASVLTKLEILAGMRPPEEPATRRLLRLFELIPVDDTISERAGALANRYLATHPGVDPVDYVIAATVEELGADLWTRNRKHFPMFPDLADPY